MYSWHRSTCWREKSSILPDTNICISSSLKTFLYRQQHWGALRRERKKSKCQESFCCCLQQNVPGYDGIVRLCWRHLNQRGAWSISMLYLCQSEGRDAASRVNDERGDRWFLLSSGMMAPSFVSVIEPKLTDGQAHKEHGRSLHSRQLTMRFSKNDIPLLFFVRTNLFSCFFW